MHTSTRLHLRIRAFLALLLTLALFPLLAPAPARAASFMVTTRDDSGDGSLRDAIVLANETTGADTIAFDVSGTIVLQSTLPTIADELTIDGTGQSITISGNNTVRVLAVNEGKTLNLNALTIANGLCNNCPGGGLFTSRGTIHVNHSSFSGNRSTCSIPDCTTGGGAIASFAGVLTVSNSTFTGNSSSSGVGGGGIVSFNGSASVSNSTFSGNSADTSGGSIANYFGSLTLSNSTFSGNSSRSIGGSIINYFGSVTLSNNILANSTAGTNCDGSFTDGGGNISYPDQTCPGANADPKLDPNGLQDNGGPTQTIALLSDSPAIGAATGDCPDTDQRGVERPQGAACDSGAYELITNHPPVAQNDSYSTTQNTPLTISAPGVLENDSDLDGDTLSAVKASDPAHGTLVLNTDGSFIYTPVAGYSGSDGFSYTASDGATTSTQAEVTITVKAASFPATAVLDTFDRANGKVGTSWEGLTDTSFYKLASNKLDVQLGGPLVWKSASFGMTQEVFVTLSTIDSKSPSQGLLLKVQTGNVPNGGAISVVYDAKAKAVRVSALRLGQNGAWTLYPNQAATFANGDVLGARAKANGAVEIYKNGTLVASVTLNAADQAFFNAKGGKIGIWTVAASNAILDDFGGGSFAP